MRREFALRYGRGGAFLGLLGLGRRFSRVALDDAVLKVHMGWAFTASIPRDAIVHAANDPRSHWWAIGVHATGRHAWLVNGSTRGVVWLDFTPMVRARTMRLPLRLRRLGISPDEPDAFVSALSLDPTATISRVEPS
jgi:hypothetical protein